MKDTRPTSSRRRCGSVCSWLFIGSASTRCSASAQGGKKLKLAVVEATQYESEGTIPERMLVVKEEEEEDAPLEMMSIDKVLGEGVAEWCTP